MISFFRGCSYKKEQLRLRKEVTILSNEIDSLNNNIENNFYDKNEFDVKLEIEGYEISKRMLYDNNAIVRTTIRPDDRMNEYDEIIKELQNNLK
jgi:hypothetical protein